MSQIFLSHSTRDAEFAARRGVGQSQPARHQFLLLMSPAARAPSRPQRGWIR
jgi:hypothetical protein